MIRKPAGVLETQNPFKRSTPTSTTRAARF
jgi:hypothetical protein